MTHPENASLDEGQYVDMCDERILPPYLLTPILKTLHCVYSMFRPFLACDEIPVLHQPSMFECIQANIRVLSPFKEWSIL